MVKLEKGALKSEEILQEWYVENRDKNYGAIVYFVGVVRDEDGIEGLSFELYEPILQKWFEKWEQKLETLNSKIFMAHSIGDVLLHESSYIAMIASPKRRVALEFLDQFVEDFKANAPIWKYDLRGGDRIYAENRSHKIEGSGILSRGEA